MYTIRVASTVLVLLLVNSTQQKYIFKNKIISVTYFCRRTSVTSLSPGQVVLLILNLPNIREWRCDGAHTTQTKLFKRKNLFFPLPLAHRLP